MQLDKQDANKLLVNRSQLSSVNHTHQKKAETMSPSKLNELFQMLFDKENQRKASQNLRQYFKRNPFIEVYNPRLLNMLINFFNSDSEYGIEGVNAAARIISAFLIYEYNYKKNPLFDCLLNYEFYQIIWPFFKQSPFVIVIFQFSILLGKNEPNTSAYNFLMEKEIFELAGKLLDQEFIYSIELLCLINSFDSYYNRSGILRIETYELCINSISKIIPTICEKVFSSDNHDVMEYGCYCLSSYGRHYVDIGIDIFKNRFFQQKCKDFSVLTKQNIDETEFLLQLIDSVLNNQEPIKGEKGVYELCSRIRTDAMPFNSMFIKLIFQIINSPYSKSESNDEDSEKISCEDYEFFKNYALKVLSYLYLSEEEVSNFVENGFAQRLFDMLLMNCSFKSKARVFAVITNFVVFSNLEYLKYFIDNGFLYCITDYLDEMMTEIPHQIIDALEVINRFGETKEECSEWSSLIFDNDDILHVLVKASRGEYIDPGDSCMTLKPTAQAFIERRYNECIPDMKSIKTYDKDIPSFN